METKEVAVIWNEVVQKIQDEERQKAEKFKEKLLEKIRNYDSMLIAQDIHNCWEEIYNGIYNGKETKHL